MKFLRRLINPVHLVAVNAVLFAAIVVLFVSYMNDYNKELYEQNLNDISNVNQSVARISAELSASEERKLSNILQYLKFHSFTSDELMEYIFEYNADSNVTFQLIGEDYNGYVIDKDEGGSFIPVSYNNKDYLKIQQIVSSSDSSVDVIPFSVEFTDPYTGLRSFARYSHISVVESGVEKCYTLMSVYKSSDFIDHINYESGFEGLSTVLINDDGGYALRNSDFKSESFFKYLYVYNNLSRDETELIRNKLLSQSQGSINYLNSSGEECIFVYTSVPGTAWYCITCVPLSSFHSKKPDFKFTAMLVILLTAIMTVNLFYLAALNKQLKMNAKAANAANEAKTDFLSRMSHDIRTPINVITGMTELALSEKDSGNMTEYLTNIQSSGKFLLGLVNDILDMNKVESGKMELHNAPYGIDEFNTYINAVIRPLCKEKNIEFKLNAQSKSVLLITDSLRLNQIFFNLLSNAVKFTDRGGMISFSYKINILPDKKATAEFIVEDNGVGMSKEFQSKMYSAFTQEERTLSSNINGTGLGLAIVKNIIDLMGGRIEVESDVGKGTKFIVRLDFSLSDKKNNSDTRTNSAAELAGRRILLCEDHPLNAKIIIQLLSRRGIKVEVAENGKIGTEMYESSDEWYYDAVLMDIQMPVMNGLDAARKIRCCDDRSDNTLPIIALTANAYDSDVKSCLEAGMNAHLAKPIDTQKLYDVLAEMILR